MYNVAQDFERLHDAGCVKRLCARFCISVEIDVDRGAPKQPSGKRGAARGKPGRG